MHLQLPIFRSAADVDVDIDDLGLNYLDRDHLHDQDIDDLDVDDLAYDLEHLTVVCKRMAFIKNIRSHCNL